jgi:hypothetical protein
MGGGRSGLGGYGHGFRQWLAAADGGLRLHDRLRQPLPFLLSSLDIGQTTPRWWGWGLVGAC